MNRTGSTALLSAIRPYAVALGYPVTMEGLAAHLDQCGARLAEAPAGTDGDPAILVASLPEPLRNAVEHAGPEMLAFLRSRTLTQEGIEIAARFRAVVSGHPELVLATAEALRMTPEDLLAMLLNGDAVTIRLAREVALRFGAKLDWLLGRDLTADPFRH